MGLRAKTSALRRTGRDRKSVLSGRYSPNLTDSADLVRALVAEIIQERGARCEDPACRFPGRTGIRLFGDHIVELQDGGAPLDKGNVMLRCGSCHTRKTNAERARRMGS